MRALIVTSAKREAMVGEVPEVKPGVGEVAIRVEFAGINFADVMALRGDHGYSADGPHVPGLEVVGRVDSLGSGVAGLEPGQRVAAYTAGGGFAEVAVAGAGLVVPVPEVVPPEAAAAVPVTLSTAYLLLDDVARVRAGDRILVHSAAGGIGLAVAGLVRRRAPATLLGTVGTEAKVSCAVDGGYNHVFVRGPQLVSQVDAATQGHGVSIIMGAFGTQMLNSDMRMAAPNGRIIRYGNVSGSPHAALPPLAELSGVNVSIAGFSRRTLARQEPSRVRAAFEATMAVLAQGDSPVPVTEIGGLDALPGFLDDMFCGLTTAKSVVRLAR